MNGTSTNAFSAASTLGDLFASLPVGHPEQWTDIAATAQSLANDLRVKNGAFVRATTSILGLTDDVWDMQLLVEQQTTLGKTLLPQTLTSLLKSATDGSHIPGPAQKAAIFELLRAAANLCMDHGASSFAT